MPCFDGGHRVELRGMSGAIKQASTNRSYQMPSGINAGVGVVLEFEFDLIFYPLF